MSVTLVVAIVGLTLSAVSLVWQWATFFLAGPRVRVRLHEGLAHPGGAGVVLAPHEAYTEEGLASLAAQGFTEPVFGIEVINLGRLATTVQD